MNTMILSADVLNLLESFAHMFRGKKVELTAQDDLVIIKPLYEVKELEVPLDLECEHNPKLPRSTAMGMFDGQIWMSDDFDEPLECLKDYMP